MTGKVTSLVTETGDAVPGTLLAVPGARALVVGTRTHAPGSLLPNIPAVAATVAAVGAALVQRCGLTEDQVATLTDPADPRALLHALTEADAAARDVLLLYYVRPGRAGTARRAHREPDAQRRVQPGRPPAGRGRRG
jgi:hypothetical protein